MDIRIPDYTRNGQRVLSTECSLCQTCITVCSKDALKLSFGFDVGGKDLLRVQDIPSPRLAGVRIAQSQSTDQARKGEAFAER